MIVPPALCSHFTEISRPEHVFVMVRIFFLLIFCLKEKHSSICIRRHVSFGSNSMVVQPTGVWASNMLRPGAGLYQGQVLENTIQRIFLEFNHSEPHFLLGRFLNVAPFFLVVLRVRVKRKINNKCSLIKLTFMNNLFLTLYENRKTPKCLYV